MKVYGNPVLNNLLVLSIAFAHFASVSHFANSHTIYNFFIITAHAWTTQVWTACVHLHVDFLQYSTVNVFSSIFLL